MVTTAQGEGAVTSHSCSNGLRFKAVITYKRVGNMFANSLVKNLWRP